jgi:RNA polymerase sigma-70 factor (ECF subfamily)
MTATLTRTVRRAAEAPVRGSHLAEANDRDLVARVAGGDRDALGELYRRHRGKVAGYVRRRIPIEADTDDVVHETFLRAVRDAGGYQPEQGHEVRSWLCGLAAWQLRDYARKDRWPYLAAVDATREALARPGIESSEEREAKPLSAPVRAAVERLSPAERRAVQLRYLDGLDGRDAAEHAGSSRSSINTNAMSARRKLAWMLADQAPAASSPVQEMRPGHAIEAALDAVGYDKPAQAQEWLRQRGVRVSKSHVYNIRNRGPGSDAEQDQQPVRHGTAQDQESDHAGRVARGTDEHGLRALPERGRPGVKPVLRDRARAASQHYRDEHGRLPAVEELAEAAGVSRRTAGKVLAEVTGPRPPGTAPVLRERALAASQHYRDEHGRLPTTAELADAARVGHTTARKALRELTAEQPARPDRPSAGQTVGNPASARHEHHEHHDEPTRPAVTNHRVRVRSQAVHSTPLSREHTSSRRREEASAASGQSDDASGPASADVSIARARVALAVLNAHRAERDQRQSVEQARGEQLARWHHDEHHNHDSRTSTGRAHDRASDGEDYTR